jgi:hypothetical protein
MYEASTAGKTSLGEGRSQTINRPAFCYHRRRRYSSNCLSHSSQNVPEIHQTLSASAAHIKTSTAARGVQ